MIDTIKKALKEAPLNTEVYARALSDQLDIRLAEAIYERDIEVKSNWIKEAILIVQALLDRFQDYLTFRLRDIQGKQPVYIAEFQKKAQDYLEGLKFQLESILDFIVSIGNFEDEKNYALLQAELFLKIKSFSY